MSATQTEIARLTGFSPSTVSRAMANHPGIPLETRQKIELVAEQLGYRKNAVVAHLMVQLRSSRQAGARSTLAYVTSRAQAQIYGANYCAFYQGAKDRAEALGYQLDVIWRRERSMTAEKFNKILLARGIRGVLIAPRPNPMGHITIDWSRYASASVGHPLPTPHIHHASAWHHQIIDTALRTITKYGYKKIGFAIGPQLDRYTKFAFSCRYLLHWQRTSAAFKVPMLCEANSSREPTIDQFEKWFHKHRPDAILCGGPTVGNWLKELGIPVPEATAYADLALATIPGDCAGMWEHSEPVGACAVDLVVEQLQTNEFGIPKNPKAVLVQGNWVDGSTLPRKTIASKNANSDKP